MQARYYDPVIGRFLSVDPVGFSPDKPGMFNRYAYTLNDPVNRIDPTGETDIYIGGAGDSTSKIVQSYASAQSRAGGRTVGYFKQTDFKGIVAFTKKNANNGETLNIIGHSYGAATVVNAARALAKDGIDVDNLVGVDGVKKAFRPGGLGDAKDNVGNVIGVNSTGDGTRDDVVESAGKALGIIATLGSGKPKAFTSGNADVFISTNTNHADFTGAMATPGGDGLSAKGIIDNSYKEKK